MIRPFDTGHERTTHRENNILVHICDPGRINKYTETEIYPIYVFLHYLCRRLFLWVITIYDLRRTISLHLLKEWNV